jgi:diguanylate cyclase (GGDEF)-like protein/PAS domain S-box-containing protein
MSIWGSLTQRAKEATYTSAAILTLIFVAPIGLNLISHQNQINLALEKRAQLHADIYSQRIENMLNQTVAATSVLSDSFQQHDISLLARTAGSILRIIGPAAILEISPDGAMPLVITHRNVIPNEFFKQALPNTPAWQHPAPLGEPAISIHRQQLTITQSLANRSTEGRTRFWGNISIILPFTALWQGTQVTELASENLSIQVRYILDKQNPGTVLFDNVIDPRAILAHQETRLTGGASIRVVIAPLTEGSLYSTLGNWVYLTIGGLFLFAVNIHLLRRPTRLDAELRLRNQLLDNEKNSLKQEIEGRTEAEKMLGRSYRLLDSIFEHIPGMIILKRASDRRIVRVNRSGEEILNRTRQSLIGRSNDEIYDAKLASRLNSSDDELLKSLTQQEIPLERVTMPGQAGRWLKLRKTALLGEEDKPEYILEFGQDVTEQEQLDLRLREHLHFLEQLIDAIPSPLFFKDTKGRYISVNKAFEEYIGIGRTELSGKTVFDISPPTLAHMYHRADMDLLAMGGQQSYESSVRDAAGNNREVIFHKAVFHQTDGDVGGIVGILLDITERKHAELQVSRMNRFLTLLSDANQAIVRIREQGKLLTYIAELLCKSGKFPIAWVHLKQENSILICQGCKGKDELIRDVISAQECWPDSNTSTAFYRNISECFVHSQANQLELEGLKAYVSLPLLLQGVQIGSIGILDTSLDIFDASNQQLIEDFSNNISHALESMQAETQQQAAAEQLQLAARVFENSAEGIVITDANNKILMVNKTFAAVTGYAPSEVIGQNPNLLSSGRQNKEFYNAMWESLHINGEWRGEIENRRKNGELYPERINISVVRQADGNISNYVAVFSDLTNRKEIENRLVFLSHFDSLTALPNRLQFHDQIQHATSQATTHGTKIAVLTLDLDRFKLFNDTMGNAAGDRLLIEASSRLKTCIPAGDSLCRLGGDEFAIILNNIDTASDAASVALACQRKLRKTIHLDQHEIHLSVSIGISLFPDDANTHESLISNADSAMYVAIEQGGNTFRFFQQEMNARSSERMRIESRLHHALERGELSVYFQPLVCAKSGRIAGAEALLRWESDELGSISPNVFIPLMEETQLIRPIGQWVLRKACEENKRWREATGSEIFVAVNLSAVQLSDENLIPDIQKILFETNFDPRYLEIELTESAVMHDAELGLRTLNQIKQLGVTLSIDDFGTGYSSLSYLKQFPLDTLKIDRSFVIDAAVDKNASAIIRAIVAMGHTLGFHIIAEGVEDIDQVEFLRDVSVEILQGYHFSRALPAAEFAELLKRSPIYSLPQQSRFANPEITLAHKSIRKSTHH